MSDTTKHYRRLFTFYFMMSALCTIGPVIYFAVVSMMAATPTQKVTIGFTLLASLILALVNFCLKVHPRAVFWLVLLAAYYLLGNVLSILIVMFITCFLDEVWFTPMYKYARQKLSINKEIDKRNG